MTEYPIIYKQFHTYIPTNEMSDLQWFALKPNYGESYGNLGKAYKFKRQPKLLDIGNADIRTMIKNTISPENNKIVEYSNPDFQYSGNLENKKYHNLVKQYFGDEYDGTIINEEKLNGNDEYSTSDLEGPSEIVIWKDHDSLLDELTNGGNKSRKNKSRKNKSRKNKSIKNKSRKNKSIKNKSRKNKSRKNKYNMV